MSARVLIVDDEIAIGICLGRILRGHEVQLASTGAQALILLIAGEHYDVLFVDVGLTDMSGVQLIESVLRLAPDQARQIVFITAGDREAVQARFPRHVVLEKPFDAGAVRQIVEANIRASA
jgi:CheY-like chemotaxis protein